jgi:transposase
MQAIERDGATLPTQFGLVERREFNYIRHGTQVLTVNLHLATGKLLTATIQDTRTEVDFVAHITRTVNTDSQAPWVFLCDQLNTHKSQSLVRYVAESIGDTQNLGEKGKTGILKDMTTPKHCSWLNPVEVWFSILTTHVLKRGNFTSIADLQQKLTRYMTYYNKHLAKAWNWSVIKTTDIHQLIDKVQQIECEGTFRGLAD